MLGSPYFGEEYPYRQLVTGQFQKYIFKISYTFTNFALTFCIKILHYVCFSVINDFCCIFRLHAVGLNGRIVKRKPKTTPEIRVRWARLIQPWSVLQNWRLVVFSDKIRVTLCKCYGRTIVWRQDGERYAPQCLHTPPNCNINGVMFWGCIGYGRKGHLVDVVGNMDQHQYMRILQQHLIPSAETIFRQQDPRFVFQPDNAPPHTACATPALLGGRASNTWYGHCSAQI